MQGDKPLHEKPTPSARLALVGKREARALAKPAVAALTRVWRFDITAATIAALKKKMAAL